MLILRGLFVHSPTIGSCRTQLPQNLTAGAWKCIIGVNFCTIAPKKYKKMTKYVPLPINLRISEPPPWWRRRDGGSLPLPPPFPVTSAEERGRERRRTTGPARSRPLVHLQSDSGSGVVQCGSYNWVKPRWKNRFSFYTIEFRDYNNNIYRKYKLMI